MVVLMEHEIENMPLSNLKRLVKHQMSVAFSKEVTDKIHITVGKGASEQAMQFTGEIYVFTEHELEEYVNYRISRAAQKMADEYKEKENASTRQKNRQIL
jgi:hypothetical protein